MKPFPAFFVKSLPWIFVFFGLCNTLYSQIEHRRTITYKQISNFETAKYIGDMKISGDGSNIVFSTGGPEIKVYTMGVSGDNLMVVYDYESTGYGPSVDISTDGDKIIWCDGYGEIFIANIDGSGREEIATLLPNPNPIFADFEPTIPVPPRMTGYGTEVFFMTAERDPLASGLWKVNANGSGLKQVFNYLDVASDVFGTDGSEYNSNIAYTDGFDISGNGDFVIFGTRTFQLLDGEMEKGDAIVYNAGEFYNLSTYATGNQPFATYVDGDAYLLFRREDNAETGFEEINLYSLHLAGGEEIKLIEGLGIFSYPQKVQMTSSGTQGIVLAGGQSPSTPPITFVSSYPKFNIDLVNIDDVSIPVTGGRMSDASLPSINLDGDAFCFLMPTNPAQIWLGQIRATGVNEDPSIANVSIEPTEVLADGSSSARIKAEVKTQDGPIQKVAVSAFLDGTYKFRAFRADWPGLLLANDGTLGDESSNDHYYTNNTIRNDLITPELGDFTVRIAAANSTLREITASDFYPLSIVEELTNPSGILENEISGKEVFVSPNPFSEATSIKYSVPIKAYVKIEVCDISGKLIEVLVDEFKMAGTYLYYWNVPAKELNKLSKGVYLCKYQIGEVCGVEKLLYFK